MSVPLSVPPRPDLAPQPPVVVVDVGSNTIHAFDLAGRELKQPVRLGSMLEGDCPQNRHLSQQGVEALVEALEQVKGHFCVTDPAQVHAFATSAVRDSTNQAHIVQAVAQRTGIVLTPLSPEDEAGLTYRWAADWYIQRHPLMAQAALAMVDIGGGSVEVAAGVGAQVQSAASLPVGAAWLTAMIDPATAPHQAVAHWQDLLDNQWKRLADIDLTGRVVVGTSKTWSTLAAVCGTEAVEVQALHQLIEQPHTLRDKLQVKLLDLGLSEQRVQQSLAGAVVAHSFMSHFGVDMVQVCRTGALREAYVAYVLGLYSDPAAREVAAPGLSVGLMLSDNVTSPPAGVSSTPRHPKQPPSYRGDIPYASSGDQVAICIYRPARRSCGSVHVQRLP